MHDFGPVITNRLTLMPSSLEIEEATMHGADAVSELTNLCVPTTWPGEDWLAILPHLLPTYHEHPDWCAWNRYIVHSADRTVIGSIGCIQPPDNTGSVNVGFYVVPEYRRQGFAREAASAFIAWLREEPEVISIHADCFVTNSASIRVLESAGMRRIGEFVDNEGKKIAWIR